MKKYHVSVQINEEMEIEADNEGEASRKMADFITDHLDRGNVEMEIKEVK